MKQLEPILKYHFWILLGVGLIMAFTGWWLTTGQMQAAITKRKGDIETAVKKLPSGEVPSKDWEAKLKVINDVQERLVRQSRDGLYARQKERMIWPEVILEAAAKLKYRDEFNDVIHRINYRDTYSNEVERVYAIPRPILPEDTNGVVNFPLSAMPHRVWGDLTPTSKQMWDSMEDLWLLEPILQAILEVNGGPDASRYDASILVIEQLKLRGGDRSKIGQSGSGGGGVGGGVGAGGAVAGAPAGFGATGFGSAMADDDRGEGSFTGGGVGAQGLSADDNVIFGDPGASSGGGVGSGIDPDDGPVPGRSGFGVGAGAGESKGSFSGSFSGGMQNNAEETGRRYIDEDTTLPYRTRGFRLAVVMDHRKVPELYSQLTSSERSPWPIQILQMHVGRLSDSGGLQGELAMGGGQGVFAGAAAVSVPTFGGATSGLRGIPMLSAQEDDDRPYIPATGAGGGRVFSGPGTTGRQTNPMVDMMQSPYLARVIFWGTITLYNEPEKKDAPAPANPSTQAPSTGTAAVSPETDGEVASDEAGEKGAAETDEEMMSDEDDRAAPESSEETDASDTDASDEPSANDERESSKTPAK